MIVSKETAGYRVVSVGGGEGVKCSLVYPHVVALYTMNYLSSYTAFDTCVRVFRPDSPLPWRLPFSSMKLSPNGKFVSRVPRVSAYHS